MTPFQKPTFRSTFITSSTIVGALSLLQVLSAGGPSIFGKSVSGLAAGVIQYYPGIAVGEVLKIHAFMLFICLFIVHYFRFAKALLKISGMMRVAFYSGPVIAWLCVTLASIIQYPALYESGMLGKWPALIYNMAGIFNPSSLQAAAIFLGFSPVLAGIIQRAKGRKELVVLFLLFMVRGSGPSAAPATASAEQNRTKYPDVILIGIDSLRTDRFLNPKVMPTLNSLREDESTASFGDHIVGIPRTFPSWIEILQGRYSAETGIRHMFPGFSQREGKFNGLVTRMKEAGYETTVISDFAGDIFPRFDAGFDEVLAPAMTLGSMIRQSVDLMFPLYLPFVTSSVGRPFFRSLKTAPVYSDAQHLVDEAIEKLGGRGKVSPKLITLFFSTAHFPYAAPYPYYKMFTDKNYSGPFYFQKNPALNGDETGLTQADMNQVNGLYDGALRSIDDSIARLVEYLKSTGKWQHTMVVITADHGEDLYDGDTLQGHGEHLRGENVLRVPLLIRMPSTIPLVSRKSGFVSRSIDIAPTMLGLLDLKSDDFGGVDYSQWLRTGGEMPKAQYAYAETEIWFSRSGNGAYQKQRLDYPGISGLLTFDAGYSGEVILNPKFESMMVTSRHRALMDSKWKLIYVPSSEGIQWELYNRVADPKNNQNLFYETPDIGIPMQESLMKLIEKLEPKSKIVSGYVVPQ